MVGVVSLGTVPAGTTEAQVDDMILVIEVAGEDTPAPRSGLDRKWLKSKTLLYNRYSPYWEPSGSMGSPNEMMA